MPAPDLPVHPEQAPRLSAKGGLRLREDTLYTNHKGEEKKSIRKRADKALDKLQEVLPRVLEADEVVLYVARVQAPVSTFEQLGFGWYIYYVTATALVFTNRRLLRFLLKGDGTWKQSLRGVRWGDITEAKVKGWLFNPTLRLKYRNGKNESYWRLHRDDAKKIKTLLAVLLPAGVGEATSAEAMVSLCPDCLAALTPGLYQCNQCTLTFKDERTMIRCSLLLPGGGYFYGGHVFLGVGDFIVETLLSAWVVVWLLVALGFPEPGLGPLEPAATPKQALFVAAIIAALLALEKWFTVHHGRRFVRDFIPAREATTSVRWPLYGLVSILAVLLLVWAFLPKEEVVAQVAPDLLVTEAHFGLFGSNQAGNTVFAPGTVVPRVEGQQYGWVLRVKTPRQKVKWREEILARAGLEEAVAGESSAGPREKQLAVNEGETAPQGGVLGSVWTVGLDNSPGTYKLLVYVDDVLVRTFAFKLK